MKVTGKCTTPIDLDVKRFYIDGYGLSGECPKCGAKFVDDFGAHYFPYPTANVPIDRGCYCNECDHEWTVKLRIDLTVTMVES